MNTAQKLERIAENVQKVYDAGRQKEEDICKCRHYAAVVTGNGQAELSFHLPFAPDFLEIVNHDPDLRMSGGNVAFFHIDLSALGELAGVFGITSGPLSGGSLGTYTDALAGAVSLPTRYRQEEDGTVYVGNLVYKDTAGVWAEGVEYVVTAARCVEKSDKERITGIIERLPEDGACRIHIRKAKKEAAFTEEEWQALIAGKSTYTFILV